MSTLSRWSRWTVSERPDGKFSVKQVDRAQMKILCAGVFVDRKEAVQLAADLNPPARRSAS